MARKKQPKASDKDTGPKPAKGKKQEQEQEQQEHHQPRPFWSGVIAFGLVSLPVSLFPANRGKALSLNMVDQEGNPLRRQFFCDKEEKMLTRDDIVRGYPVDKDQFIVVEDEELEALAPEKTREIDLRRFVPLEEINPVFFERGYFLAPDSDATKAYRLLAKSMEEEQRAGIATFVMRDREYLIAIMSERGILRAETLRFHDEIRTPGQVGLPDEPDSPDTKLASTIRRAIKALSEDKLDTRLLQEQQVQRLQELIQRKLKDREDVIESEDISGDERPDDIDDDTESNVVDLMQVLKDRLKGKRPDTDPPARASRPGKAGKTGKADKKAEPVADDLSRDELYARAREKRIPGRSKMSKHELLAALQKTG